MFRMLSDRFDNARCGQPKSSARPLHQLLISAFDPGLWPNEKHLSSSLPFRLAS